MGKIPDISYWQGYVAFSQATKDETDYIIHRASCGTSRDTRFPENVAKICALNIPYGVYHYVMALSTERAKYEAEVFYNSVAKANPAYPPTWWWADVEDPPLVWANGKSLPMNPNLHAIVQAFYKRLRELVGEAHIGFYGGESIYEPYGKLSDIGFEALWFANYSKDPKSAHHLHQYTSKGTWNNRTRIDLSKIGPNGSLEMLTQCSTRVEATPVKREDDPKATTEQEHVEIATGTGVAMATCTVGKSWNLRSGDGTKYPAVSFMLYSEKLPYVGTGPSGWVCVRKGADLLWVSPKAVAITDADGKAITPKAVSKGRLVRVTEPYAWHVRAGDGTGYASLLIAYQGYEWEHVATSVTGWYGVRLQDGRIGWITPKAAKVVVI